jgi:hypothetical protein
LHSAGRQSHGPRRPTIPVKELTVTYGGGHYTKNNPPLVLMQVTEFSYGEFVIGVTWEHAITDGVGMAQFLQTVGDFARGFSSPSVVPVRLDYRLAGLPLPITSMANSLDNSAHEFPSSNITVPMSFINRVKEEFCCRCCSQSAGDNKGAPCSMFKVFVATTWKCRTRTTMCKFGDQDAPTALAFTTNVRTQADVEDGYYGNLFTFSLDITRRHEVADADILDLVTMVMEAKAQVPYTFMDGAAYIAGEIDGRLNGLPVYDTIGPCT